jgi:homospermidine synthase
MNKSKNFAREVARNANNADNVRNRISETPLNTSDVKVMRNVTDNTDVKKLFEFDLAGRRILQIGHGGVGSSMPPLYARHLKFAPGDVTIIDRDHAKIKGMAAKWPGISFTKAEVTKQNYKEVYAKYLRRGDVLVDLAWYVSTPDTLAWCKENGVMFVNTAIESWQEEECKFMNKKCQPLYPSQVQIREMAKKWGNKGPTAILSHGANPGWVSHAMKIGIREWCKYLASKNSKTSTFSKAYELAKSGKFAEAAKILNIQAIHIAERDTQISKIPRQVGEFVNTWSPMGFVEEGLLPAELGWGTHETLRRGVHQFDHGPRNEVWFDSLAMNTLVKSHVPSGDIVGMVVPHEESNSISHFLTVKKFGSPTYRPTVHYAYYPPNDAITSMYEIQAEGYKGIKKERVMKDDIVSGKDELGIFMMSRDNGCWWIGSLLDIETSRKLIPHQSATVVQVSASVLAAVVTAIREPDRGPIFPEDLDSDKAMKIIKPYLGKFVSYPLEWTPKNVPEKYAKERDWVIQKLLVTLP